LVQPNSLFLDYQNRLDLRLGKTFRFNRTRIQGFVDIFNVMNAGTVLSVNQTYGAVAATNGWVNPTTIMPRRFGRFRIQLTFGLGQAGGFGQVGQGGSERSNFWL